ncbi:5-formyltetrahydrofolate cyclo-ligase [Thermocaproicibacter melissae]|jgi:5-formyltetrahydrofolate cyclo-ligase|uniref:5-formyltetrahydrofolate cyclo-ligase n=1 Tax=Thermocaproicibacter melissae TaxID=2966552 RepID=UPI0024B26D76|nr:5-formyltetrahydrofolate cyclo-ligase [Thermocaproicibacter melissae]WBY64912.1 5-formyltetrahydrofolate cyclo-ligase [Thermocaproicibacter melissae]
MYIRNIKEKKMELRQQNREFRRSLSAETKSVLDRAILKKVLSLREYEQADVVYTYVSKAEETDTIALIHTALREGKVVAVPRCLPETTSMEFLEISSLDDLERGTYGVLEPIPGKCPPVREAKNAFCVVPGLCFDSKGYRLGYGKGYYDRFLSGFRGFTVGLCYSGCIRWNLPHGYYDRPVDVLITEKFIRRIAHGSPRR